MCVCVCVNVYVCVCVCVCVAVPGPVEIFRSINIGDNHVNLEWKPPEHNRGDILGYDIGYQSGRSLVIVS